MENLFASSLHFIINVYNPHNILTVHYAIGHKHIKLPLVFKDVGLFRAFSTDTNELSIPTRCVLCLLMVHQISLYILSYDSHNHYNCKSFDRHNHQICAVFRAESNASHFEMPCHSYCISISFPCLHYAQSSCGVSGW